MKKLFQLFLFIVLTSSSYADVSTPFSNNACKTNRVLMLSDSQGLGPYGENLENWFLSLQDTQVQIQNLGGAHPEYWLSKRQTTRGYEYDSCSSATKIDRRQITKENGTVYARDLKKLVSTAPGVSGVEILVFSFGGNVPGVPSIYEKLIVDFMALVPDHPNRVCFWIAPITFSRGGTEQTRSEDYQNRVYTAMANGLQKSGAHCTLIDPRPFAQYPKPPGKDPQKPQDPQAPQCTADTANEPAGAIYDGIHLPFTCTGQVAADKITGEITTTFKSVLKQAGWATSLGIKP